VKVSRGEGNPGHGRADNPCTAEHPSRSRPPRPSPAAQAHTAGPWQNSMPTRRAAAWACAVWSPPDQDI